MAVNPFKGYTLHSPIHFTSILCIGSDPSWNAHDYPNDNAKTWNFRKQIIASNPFKGLSIQAPIDPPSNRYV